MLQDTTAISIAFKVTQVVEAIELQQLAQNMEYTQLLAFCHQLNSSNFAMAPITRFCSAQAPDSR